MFQQLLSAAVRGRRVPRKGFTALNSKRGPQNFYKGKGAEPTGKHTRKGKCFLHALCVHMDLRCTWPISTCTLVLTGTQPCRWIPTVARQDARIYCARSQGILGKMSMACCSRSDCILTVTFCICSLSHMSQGNPPRDSSCCLK